MRTGVISTVCLEWNTNVPFASPRFHSVAPTYLCASTKCLSSPFNARSAHPQGAYSNAWEETERRVGTVTVYPGVVVSLFSCWLNRFPPPSMDIPENQGPAALPCEACPPRHPRHVWLVSVLFKMSTNGRCCETPPLICRFSAGSRKDVGWKSGRSASLLSFFRRVIATMDTQSPSRSTHRRRDPNKAHASPPSDRPLVSDCAVCSDG